MAYLHTKETFYFQSRISGNDICTEDQTTSSLPIMCFFVWYCDVPEVVAHILREEEYILFMKNQDSL